MQAAKNKLLELRKKNNLTQPKMAEMLNMSASTYNKYKTNPGRMKDDLKQHIANTFHIPVSELMPENGNAIFENGNTNNGNGAVSAQHYYHVPKELLDSIVEQQKALTMLLEKMAAKL
jgi:transcriptional regulator with XRE-family HTH domain